MTGSVSQRSPGTWSLRFDIPTPDGSRKQKRVTFRGTKRAAEQELTRLLNAVHTGGFVDAKKITVGTYLRQWLEGRKTGSRRAKRGGKNSGPIAPTTGERYTEIVEKHLIPALGSRLLHQLRPVDVKQYLAYAAENGRRNGGGALSSTTVLQHYRVLAAALHDAVQDEIVPRNVCEAVAAPQKATPAENVLSTDEAATVLLVTRDSEMYLPVVLALSTGARRGEVCALRWKDVDLQRRQVTISRSLEVTKATGLQFKVPKTRNGVRTAPLLPFAVKALQIHRKEQDASRVTLGLPPTEGDDLIVGQSDGDPLHPDRLTQRWARLAEKINRPEVRLHDLRHSTASFLLAMGVPLSEVSRILGHATAAFTINTYGHLLPGAVDRATEALDASLGAAVRSADEAQLRIA